MLPSILAAEILEGLKSFVTTGFETSTPLFQGMFSRLLEQPGKFYKGPYLGVDLPFQRGSAGRDFFSSFPTEHPPYLHQQQAWQRLSSNRQAAATLIATGTGSGKTECFLYPILDHCVRHPGKGIKAIIVYPMNALATDQARRMSKLIHNTAGLKAVRVGLYVGEQEELPARQMEADRVISDKHVLKDNPPDILLTNYKMLDFLLMRPSDQPLWRFNQADTLSYLVVDELHTFDGAQGTDLACLIRRLKARLQCQAGALICAGTSATLGGQDAVGSLTAYASQVFQAGFDLNSVVGESRQDTGSFMAGSTLEYYFVSTDHLSDILPPQRYSSMEAYIHAQYTLFFGQEPNEAVSSPAWRSRLGGQLKQHLLFYNFLQLLAEQPLTLDALAEKMRRMLPATVTSALIPAFLNSLCALIAWARSPDSPTQPLATLRMQLWIRELRRMVAPLRLPRNEKGEAQPVPLTFADDLRQGKSDMFLPLVQCTQCHATAWAAVKPKTQGQLKTDLRVIYNAFFGHQPELVTLFPVTAAYTPPRHVHGLTQHLCASCGTLQNKGDSCSSCGESEFRQVFVPHNLRERKLTASVRLESEHNCPMCGGRNALMVFGSRSASLSSVAIFHTYATSYNDDKKLIAFSDSVQDAAHRAGFFAARTWQNNVRMAIAQAVPMDGITLSAFYQHLPRYWRDQSLNPQAMSPERFISEFIAPNMMWLENYQSLLEHGHLAEDKQAGLLADIERRLEWEVLAEFGYRGNIGRTLQRTGTVGLGIAWQPVQASSQQLLTQWQEELGLRGLTLPQVQHFILGFLWHLKERGAIYHPMLERYITHFDGGNYFFKTQHALPDFAPQTPAPVFVCNRNSHSQFDCLIQKHGNWYQDWCRKVLMGGDVLSLANQADEAIYQSLLPVLVAQGLLLPFESQRGLSQITVWGLNPDQLYLSRQVVCMATDQHRLYVPESMLDAFAGLPSLMRNDSEHYGLRGEPVHWLARLYQQSEVHRVIAHEHTGLLEREERQQVEEDFMHGTHPWSVNLLSATPTLEMGIDIGDLSSVLLCSVPPAQANYLQRIGRAGRRDGNAFSMTVAEGSPHDLYFYAEPREMLAGKVESPGVFLDAPAVITRQLTAFCFDRWVASGIDDNAIPKKMRAVLDAAQRNEAHYFPQNFLAFVRLHAGALLEDFLRLFQQDNLAASTRQHLTGFLLGGEEIEALDHRITRHIHEVIKERAELSKQRDKLKARLKRLRAMPQDEAIIEEITHVDIEDGGLGRIIANLNGQQVLNFFTDEGLLPNYAFPESGVTLRSVIYRRSQTPDKATRKYENTVFEYERPAAAAISELAPENRFYAGGRKVTIQQIDMKLSKLEHWRFCPSCSFAEVEKAEVAHACPRCAEPMWADSGQQVALLRLRQVMANTSDRDSRISDDSEDREPAFYSRQMLADFDQADVDVAWRLDSDHLPFGFEFIRKASFREINFGKQGSTGKELAVAGETLARPGFRLCKHCGMVQVEADKPGQEAAFLHTYSCPQKDKPSEEDIVDCLYLYREFRSEALRILLPVMVVEGADRYLNSFIAGLQLGLKRKFGGKVDHLRVMDYSAPMPGTDTRKQFLMLYDSVPGGTGYLKTLMDDPQKLLEVFQIARDAMASCGCNHEPGKDGCYRCLYAYRNSHGMETTSRTLATQLFSDILELRDKLVSVGSINDIPMNPVFDSELEARFIEALRRFALRERERPGNHAWDMQLQTQVVNGKPGYYLRIGQQEYTIEPQGQLPDRNSLDVVSKPDFLIRVSRSSTAFTPIAIFLDGYEYHKASVTEDSLKRLALVQSGQYRQWSLTWQDVNAWFAKNQTSTRNPFVEGQLEAMAKLKDTLIQRFELEALRRVPLLSPLEQLLWFLRDPDQQKWVQTGFLALLGWFNPQTAQSPVLAAAFTQALPVGLQDDWMATQEMGMYGSLGLEDAADPLSIFCYVPQSALAQFQPEKAFCSVVLDNSAAQAEPLKAAWQGYLRAYNLLQFLPKTGFFTRAGLQQGVYECIRWYAGVQTQPFYPAVSIDRPGTELKTLLALTLESLHEALHQLADKHLPMPVVGFELQQDNGEILAEAELAWESRKIAGLLAGQMDQADVFQRHGWEVLELDDNGLWLDMFTSLTGENHD